MEEEENVNKARTQTHTNGRRARTMERTKKKKMKPDIIIIVVNNNNRAEQPTNQSK